MAAPNTRSRTRSRPIEQPDNEVTEDLKQVPTQSPPVVVPGPRSSDVKEATTPRSVEKNKTKEAQAAAKREAENRARQAKIASGDLIVKDGKEYERNTKETKVYGQISQIVDLYRDSPDVPLIFSEVVDSIGARYPEDLIPAMHALEHLGLVQRYDSRITGDGAKGKRGVAAYKWVNEE